MRAFDHEIWAARAKCHAAWRLVVATGLLTLAGAMLAPAWAQYAIAKYAVVSGGSTRDVGGAYTLGASIGLMTPGQMTGGGYSLGGGFWGEGGGGTASIEPSDNEATAAIPLAFRLYPTAPNPLLVGRTTFAFDLPQPGVVRVLVYDVAGRLTRTLVEGPLPAGQHRRVWDGADDTGHRVAAGIYFLRVHTQRTRAEQKIVVLK